MAFLDALVGILWGPWTMFVLLIAGILFTIWTRFTQFTAMTHGVQVVRGIYDDPDDPGAINHFQALSAALSATVGLGNIGGVALAIGAGGPGALFWIWIVGIFGMALKTVEITLAMMYRNTDDPDNPHGGAMWVVDKVMSSWGPSWVPLAKGIGIFFCITLIVSCFTGGNMFQSWSVATLTEGYFGMPREGTGILMAVIVGLVIIGGIKRIGNVAGKLVPFMCIVYVLSALAVLGANIDKIPDMLILIVKSAFAPAEATGAFVGGGLYFAFTQGMRRALFSNEAGQGSAPIAHAAAKTDEPAREGIVGGMGPFIDTLCICTITALVILSTDTWNREAIGDFKGPVSIVRAASDTDGNAVNKWTVEASIDAKMLPESRLDDWTVGADFFFVGTVEGATKTKKRGRSNRVKITGSVVEAPDGSNPEVPRELQIEWDPVELDPSHWDGQPTAVKLENLGIHRKYAGAQLTGHAFDREFPGLGRWLVTLAAWLFAISTMISWSYYGEQGMVYMLGERSVLPYKLVFLAGTIWAAAYIDTTRHMELLMDLGTGAMLWSNIPIVLGLGFLAVGSLASYKRRLKAGEFHPHKAPPITDVVDGSDVE